MQSVHDSFISRLAPHWVAAAVAVAALLGLWPCIELYKDTVPGSAGAGWIPFLIIAPIIFSVLLLVLTYPLVWLLGRLESDLARSLVCLVPVGAFLARHGVPNLFCLVLIGFVTASAYIDVRRRRANAHDRKEFLHE